MFNLKKSYSLDNINNLVYRKMYKTSSLEKLNTSTDFDITTLREYVGNDNLLKKNIIRSCNMYCGTYYINLTETIKKYFKKSTKKKEIYVAIKTNDSMGINKIHNILAYCIITYKQDNNKYLIKLNETKGSIGYRYVDIKGAIAILGSNHKSIIDSSLNIAYLNVICALTPDIIPILPIFKYRFKYLSVDFSSLLNYERLPESQLSASSYLLCHIRDMTKNLL